MSQNLVEAKKKLDVVIGKQRVSLYKPIQIAEILFHVRLVKDLALDDLTTLETYRNRSKSWRDDVSIRLIGRFCTSSQKFQDNLFEENALPPRYIATLARHNNEKKGIVEAYIYEEFRKKQATILEIHKYIRETKDFQLKDLLKRFEETPGIRRSVGDAYEIVVYALFFTLLKHLGVKITIRVDPQKSELLHEFEDFARKVVGIDPNAPPLELWAAIYRTGSTSAADRGLDIWANFGPAIQVKHLALSEELVEEIEGEILADRIVVVCAEAEKKSIATILRQLPDRQRIQSIVTEADLVQWYNLALHGKFSPMLANDLMRALRQEFDDAFPYSKTLEGFIKERGYTELKGNNSPFSILKQSRLPGERARG